MERLPFKRVAFIMSSNWRFLFQRPHHFAERFKAAGLETVVFEVSGARSLLADLGNSEVSREQRETAHRIWSAVYPPGVVRRVPTSAAFFQGMVRRSFERFAERYLDGDTLMWLQGLNSHLPPETLFAARRKLAVVDICDDYAAFFEGDRSVQDALVRCEDQTVRAVDAVVVSAPRLHERLVAKNPDIVLARNGVSMRFLAAADGEKLARTRPLVVYQGALAGWVDFELLEAVVDRLPGFDFVVLGKSFPDVRDRIARLEQRPNVQIAGVVPHHELPGRLAAADVGIIPFRINELTLATDPIKLYEYLGCGLPVVSTPMPEVELRAGAGVVEVAADAESFARRIREAAERRWDGSLLRRRLQVAGENTWDRRFEQIAGFLSDRAGAIAAR